MEGIYSLVHRLNLVFYFLPVAYSAEETKYSVYSFTVRMAAAKRLGYPILLAFFFIMTNMLVAS